MKYDITVSVWNEFHAPELCEGLASAGFKVKALRTCNIPIPGVTTTFCPSSRVLTALFQRTSWPPLIEAGQDIFEAFARRHIGDSNIFWGWNGHHLSAFRAAKKKGQIIVCERGSTHASWAGRRLNSIHKDIGWGPALLHEKKRDIRARKEYDVADHIMVPSEFVLRTFLEEGIPAYKLHVNPYGVDVQFWSKVDGTRRAERPLIFIFTANITPRKGAHVLLQAWQRAAIPEAELWFVGGIHFPIQTLYPSGNNVKFLGSKTHSEIRNLYNEASVYVLPSFEEGMARSGIEAMCAGLPLIITAETGLTDIFTAKEHGWIVPSGDVDALVEALRLAAKDRTNLHKLSMNCRSRSATFTKEAYGLRAANIASKILH